jgi:hypothetical protein
MVILPVTLKMKPEYKILLIGLLTIGVFDALNPVISKQVKVHYLLTAIAFIVYCVFGFWGTKEKDLKTGVIIAAALGFFDSTIGWEIIMLFRTSTSNLKYDPTIGDWIFVAILVTVLGALGGLTGGGLAKYLKARQLNKPN